MPRSSLVVIDNLLAVGWYRAG